MIDRFKRPGYKLTQEDRAVFYANKLQEDLHQAAGVLVFAVTPALEGGARTISYKALQFTKGGVQTRLSIELFESSKYLQNLQCIYCKHVFGHV
jgi:hypothetical protein